MKTHRCILHMVFICALILTGCAITQPALSPTPDSAYGQLPSPVQPTHAATSPPEMNISRNRPVRVSASWVMDPPERAVDGNLNNWWGAGGPVPQWIEVDLEGVYSINRIRIINEGPTGYAPYQVFGRGPDNVNRLLYVFEGNKSSNQRLEFSPETPWEDISTIRIEINSGSGWVGLREIEVFSRQDPEPLPISAEPITPLFLTGADPDSLAVITPENAILMEQLAMFGRGPINEAVWSPDGEVLAAAGPLGVWLYDAEDLMSAPRLLEGHTRDVLSVAFSPDGTRVLSASQDGTVREWDVTTGELLRTIPLWDDFSYEVGDQKRDPEVWSITFSPDRQSLAAGSYDGTLRLWNLKTGSQSAVLEGHSAPIGNLAFSPDGRLLASSDFGSGLMVWDVASKSRRAALPIAGQVQGLTFSPDGATLAYGGVGMSVRLWDAATGEERAELSELQGVISLAFTADGEILASSGMDGSIRMWDFETNSSLIFEENVGWVTNMAFSPAGMEVMTSNWSGVIQIWETATGNETDRLVAHTSPVNSIAFSPDGTLLASGGDDGVIWLRYVEHNSLYGVMLGHTGGVTGLAFSPNGKLLASSSFDGTVRLWDTSSLKQVSVLSGHQSLVRCVAFSPDGSLVASGSTDATVRLWEVETGKERAVLPGHTGEVQDVMFSPDGLWLLSGSVDKTVRIWEVATGKESGVLQGNLSSVLSAAFSPDGKLIGSVGGDHSLRVFNWQIASGGAVARDQFPSIGHPGWVLRVTFSPDGKIIASANLSTTSYWVAPGEIHLYSADTGYPYALLRAHTRRVTSIAFSPDGKLLASGSADGSVRLWGISQNGFDSASQPVIAAPTSTPQATEEDPFVGDWTATDPMDGSNLDLSITLNDDRSYSIVYIDDGASLCGKDSAGGPRFGIKIELTGTKSRDVLHAVSTSATCLATPPSPLELDVSVNYSYEASTDSLWDSLDKTVWRRK